MLLTFAFIYNLSVTALDVKDAFLMVPQMEVLYVKIPMWIRAWTGNPHTHTHGLLKRCLPGVEFHNIGSVQTISESYFQERAKYQNRHERDGIGFFDMIWICSPQENIVQKEMGLYF